VQHTCSLKIIKHTNAQNEIKELNRLTTSMIYALIAKYILAIKLREYTP